MAALPQLLTPEEAAEYLRLEPQTVRAKLRSGEIRGVRLGPGPKAPWRVTAAELRRLAGEQREADKRDETAIHEAGHAIVGQALGIHVNEVTLRTGGGGFVLAELEPRDTLDAIRHELSFVLGGPLAVALARGADIERLLEPSDARTGNPSAWLLNTLELEAHDRSTGRRYRDYVKIAVALLDNDSLTGHRWLDRELPVIAREAVRILRGKWTDVEALAIRLKAKGEVDLGEKRRRADLEKEIEKWELRVARDRAGGSR